MRIEVLVLSGVGPVYDAVLRLADVTVLTGRNDAGKTRVLRSIEAGLMSSWDAEYVEVHGVATPAEVRACLSDPEMPTIGIVDAVSAAVAPFMDAVEIPTGGGGVRVGVLGGPVVEDLLPGWRYGRALRDLDEPTRTEVQQALCDEEVGDQDPDEPLKLEALGGFDAQILPETIVVPCGAKQMDLRVAGAVTRLTRALRGLASVWFGVADVAGPLAGGPPREWVGHHEPTGQPSEIDPSWEWLVLEDEQTNSSRVHPAAGQACEALGRIVSGLLPDFIAADYWLRVIPARPTDIVRGRFIHIQLQRRDSPDGSRDAPDADDWFALADTASGFIVWIQLALCEAVQRAKRCSYLLQQHLQVVHLIDVKGHEQTGGVTYSWEEIRDGFTREEDDTERGEIVAHRLDGLGIEQPKAALEDLLAWLQDPRRALPVIPEHPIFTPPDDDEFLMDDVRGAALEPLPRGRLYLLDEPEQRLHPMLQRQAARWLSTLMGQWGAQCVLATHSVAFMALGGDTFAYEISRSSAEQATVLPLDPATLTPYSQLAQEMGLDRGELLSLARAFLITTRPVAALLDEFCAEQLAAGQITVIPVNDRDPREILSAALLTRVTAAPLAVLLTSITPEEIERLHRADAETRAQTSRQDAEAAATVALIDDSVRHGHDIEILTLNVPSVLDLLDQAAVARFATGPAPFPGHEAAHDTHRATAETYPQFLSSTYGITLTDDLLRTVARRMRTTGILAPEVLTDAVWRVEQLALTSESPRLPSE